MPKKQPYKNVKRVKRPDGTVDFYHRLARNADGKMPALPGPYGSVEFIEAWLAAEKSFGAHQPKAAPKETYKGLWQAFEASDEWASLKPRTRADYEKVRDWMYGTGADKPDRRAKDMQQQHAEKLLDRALKETHHRFAVYVLQVNRRLFNWVQKRSRRQAIWGDRNPWATLETPKAPQRASKANRAWYPEEIVEVLSRAPMGLARAYVLGISGFDSSTMHPITWDMYRNGSFDNSRIKSGNDGHTIVPALFRPFLDSGPRPSEFIVTNELDQPFASVGAIQKKSSEFLRGLAAEDIVGPGLTMHGLRHTIAKAIADSGGTLGAIQTLLRQSTERMALHYSKEADKRRALEDVQPSLEQWFLAQDLKPDWHKKGG